LFPEMYSAIYIRASRRRFPPLDQSLSRDLYFVFAYFSHLQITIYAYCSCDLRLTIQLFLIYGHVLYGTPAFIQQPGPTSRSYVPMTKLFKFYLRLLHPKADFFFYVLADFWKAVALIF
jgi:hypothetical protein